MNELVKKYLIGMGIMPNCVGYRYLSELITQLTLGKEIFPLKHNGYKILAQKYGQSIGNIDKNIQNCIAKAWNYGDVSLLQSRFGNTIDEVKGKPTSKQFIVQAYENIRFMS
ncbi:MAG: sporulation initiation factor Spo0A C-terminal domain-containing protein [Christensenellales bacterium]